MDEKDNEIVCYRADILTISNWKLKSDSTITMFITGNHVYMKKQDPDQWLILADDL